MEKEALERRYLNTYGALSEEINRKIPGSENLKRLEKLILSLPYLPYQLNVSETEIYWFIIDDNGNRLTKKSPMKITEFLLFHVNALKCLQSL